MRIAIVRNNDKITTVKEYTNIDDKGEISHFLIELEIIKLELLNLWEEYQN